MNSYRVLIVEDDTYSQEVTALLVQHHAIEVDVAGTGEAALNLLEANSYDAAIIDLALPGLDGWELLQLIQDNPYTADMPCIAVTAFHSPKVAQDALQVGFAAYFSKPIDPETFVNKLDYYLN